MLYVIALIIGLILGCVYTEWRAQRRTVRYLQEIHSRAARPNARRDPS